MCKNDDKCRDFVNYDFVHGKFYFRGVYPYLPMAPNALWTICGILLLKVQY